MSLPPDKAAGLPPREPGSGLEPARSGRFAGLRARLRSSLGDRGYAMVLSALLIVPLLAFAGFATDIGSWYAQASRQQRAADAAALAGVIWLPDETKATSVAREIAKDNGFDHADAQITVTVTRVGKEQLRVTIRDDEADQFFSTLFIGEVDITRQATAEYTLPVPLGSPENRFGTGTLPMGGSPTYFWAAASGYCVAKEHGDRVLARYDGNGSSCPPPNGSATYSEDNASYDPDGYTYVVEVPPAPRSTVNIRVYDAGSACGGDPGDNASLPTTLVYTVYEADNTPLDDTDNPVATTQTFSSGQGCGVWTTLHSVPSAALEGRWLLNVHSLDNQYNGGGTNAFSIWAQMGSSSGYCSTTAVSDCAQVYGRDLISISINDSTGSNSAEFFLAEIEAAHEGKEMVIELWDSAEGMQFLQVLDPTGTPVDFTWRTVNDDGLYPGPYGAAPGCGSPGGPCLDVSGTGTQPGPGRVNQGKFNDRLIEITLDLPPDFSSYPDLFWKLRYVPTGSQTRDRTTWGVKIKGDPVHLVDDLG